RLVGSTGREEVYFLMRRLFRPLIILLALVVATGPAMAQDPLASASASTSQAGSARDTHGHGVRRKLGTALLLSALALNVAAVGGLVGKMLANRGHTHAVAVVQQESRIAGDRSEPRAIRVQAQQRAAAAARAGERDLRTARAIGGWPSV